jgi:hypothetical protein
MKKIAVLFTIALFSITLAAAPLAIVNPVKLKNPKASEIMLPMGKNGELLSLQDLSTMKIKDLENFTGAKMKLVDKLGFKLAQKQLRNSINEDGTINNKKITKYAKRAADGSGFHLGGFALGFLLGLIGVLIAYLIKDDLKSQRVKWAWIGLGAWLVIFLVLLLI